MQLSAEVRWFWQGPVESGLKEWFLQGLGQSEPGGGLARLDEYLQQKDQIELGLKKRGNKKGVEVKGLIAVVPSRVTAGPFTASVQLWSKWTSEELILDHLPLISIQKTRWLRKYAVHNDSLQEIELEQNETPKAGQHLPRSGCNVELTKVLIGSGPIWWTFGCEAFGISLTDVTDTVVKFMSVVLAKNSPSVKPGIEASYPAWLVRLLSSDSMCGR
jgi:hypothetical protein